MKLSQGDIAVNKAVALSSINTKNNNTLTAKLDKSQVEERKKRFFKKTKTASEEKAKQADIKAIIALDKSSVKEGGDEYKYTFDTIYEDKELAKVAKSYYGEKEGRSYDDKEAIDLKNHLQKSVELMGFPEGTDMLLLFSGMSNTIENLKNSIDN